MARQLKEDAPQSMAASWWPTKSEFETLYENFIARKNLKYRLEYEKTGCFCAAKECLSSVETYYKEHGEIKDNEMRRFFNLVEDYPQIKQDKEIYSRLVSIIKKNKHFH